MAISAKEFIQQQGQTGNTVQPLQYDIPMGISVKEFLQQQKVTPVLAQPKKENKAITTFKWLSKQLLKPVGAVAVETEALGKLIGARQGYIPGKAALEVLAGKKQRTFTDLWQEHYVQPMEQMGAATPATKVVGGFMGLMTDIAADPQIGRA